MCDQQEHQGQAGQVGGGGRRIGVLLGCTGWGVVWWKYFKLALSHLCGVQLLVVPSHAVSPKPCNPRHNSLTIHIL
jgi:hypothetical protein